MSTKPGSLDTTSKRWLTVLAVAFLASVIILARSFISVLSPQEENAAMVQQPLAEDTEQVRSAIVPASINPQPAHGGKHPQTASPVSTFDSPDAAAKKQARQQAVHQQAESLRKLIANGKLPEGYGNLTKEQVDQMEKEGVTIQ